MPCIQPRRSSYLLAKHCLPNFEMLSRSFGANDLQILAVSGFSFCQGATSAYPWRSGCNSIPGVWSRSCYSCQWRRNCTKDRKNMKIPFLSRPWLMRVFLPWCVLGVLPMFQPWKERTVCRCCFAKCLAKVCKKLLQLGAFCSRGPLQSRTALPWPEAAAKLPCSWTWMAALPRWFLSWHRCSTCSRILAPSITGQMSWDYWNGLAVWSWLQLCILALASGWWWPCWGWSLQCYHFTSQLNISFAMAHHWSCPLPWSNYSSSTWRTPLKAKSKNKMNTCGLGCMASSTLCHTLFWPDCCHTICAVAEAPPHGRNPHRRYTIATLGSVAVTTHGKLPSCSVWQSSCRPWESCLAPGFQSNAKQCGDV